MRKAISTLSLTALAAGAAMAQMNPGYTRQAVTFSPNNLFTRQSINANLPLTGGMDVFPDGRVALVEWGIPGSVFIFSGLDKGSTGIKATRFATGLDNAMGLKIVDNVIYVMEKEALTQLLDTDGDGVADQYNSINESFPSDNGMLNFAYDLGYLNGSFYAALSSDVHIGGLDWGSSQYAGTTALAGRSTMYKLNVDGTSSAFACGFRNPNGMWVNGNDIFVTENQGSWEPSSKVINVKQGRFYGHRTNPANACQTANNNAESPPVAWNNWDGTDETGRSPGGGVVLKQGRYAGQMLVGETVQSHNHKIFRVFVENVGGELQGAILPFVKSGLDGVFRIQEGPEGRLYLGLAGSSGSWQARTGMTSGFDVLVPNGTVPFEVLAVRNLGNSGFDIEFTKPAGTSAGVAANYAVRSWQQNAVEAYGGGNVANSANLTVGSATLSADKLHVTLAISGLQTGRVVKFSFSNITAQDGGALFTNFAAYTLSKLGPGQDYKPAATAAKPASRPLEASWKLVSGKGGPILSFFGDLTRPKDIAVYDLRGTRRLEMLGVTGSQVRLETSALARGMYMVKVSGAGKAGHGSLFIP